MKKAIPVIIVMLVIVAGVVVFADKHRSNTQPMSGMQSSNSSSTANSNAQSTNTVAINNFSFSPSAITVKKGTTVTWTNHDSVAHNVQETDGKDGPKSGLLTNGQSYSFMYSSVGTYAYHCSIHPEMVGTVTVTE